MPTWLTNHSNPVLILSMFYLEHFLGIEWQHLESWMKDKIHNFSNIILVRSKTLPNPWTIKNIAIRQCKPPVRYLSPIGLAVFIIVFIRSQLRIAMRNSCTIRTFTWLKIEFCVWVYTKMAIIWPFYLMHTQKLILWKIYVIFLDRGEGGWTEVTSLLTK